MKMLFSLIWGQCSDSISAKVEAQTNLTTISTTSDSLAFLKLLKQNAYFQSQKNNVQAKYKERGGSFIFYEVETLSTSPFLNISTNVSYSANRNSWSDESCQGHCSKPATWCCMPNVLRKAKFGKIVEYIDHAYLVARMSIQNQWMMPIITNEIGVLIKKTWLL